MSCENRINCVAYVRESNVPVPLPASCPPCCTDPTPISRKCCRDYTEYSEGCLRTLDCCGQVIYASEMSYDNYRCTCKYNLTDCELKDTYKCKEVYMKVMPGKSHPKYSEYKCSYCMEIKSSKGKTCYSPKLKVKMDTNMKFHVSGEMAKYFGVYENSSMNGENMATYNKKGDYYEMKMKNKKMKYYYGCTGYYNSGNYIVTF